MKLYIEGEMNFPVVYDTNYKNKEGCVWVIGTVKKELKDFGFDIIDIVRFDRYNYMYQISKDSYEKFLDKFNLPFIIVER